MSASQRGATFTRQLLTFGRKQLTQLRILNLNDMLLQMQAMLPPMIGEHIRLECCLSAEAPLVYADAMEVEQIVLNLALNARDAMNRGGQLTIRTELVDVGPGQITRNPEACPGRFVCLRVTDTGCGMDEELQRRIFEPFFTTKDAGKGSGLGLATVYGIVKELQGWIEVTSQVGVGSTFSIYLPPCKNPLSSSSSSQNHGLRGNETILLVEDEAPVRKLLRRVLEQYGYHVLEAPSSVDALKIWAADHEQIKLLLSDIIMPDGMSGRKLAAVLRSKKPKLEVILTSGVSQASSSDNDLNPNASFKFIQKPYSPEKLAALVRECLDGTRPASAPPV
jgi:CheY-like chemotaxis protein